MPQPVNTAHTAPRTETPAAGKPNDGAASATPTDEQGHEPPSDARAEGGANTADAAPGTKTPANDGAASVTPTDEQGNESPSDARAEGAGAEDGGPNKDYKTPTKKRVADGTGKKVQQQLFVPVKTPAAEKADDVAASATLTNEQGNKSPSDARAEVAGVEDGGPNEDDTTPTKKRAADGTGKKIKQ